MLQTPRLAPNRRQVLVAGGLLVAAPAWAALPASMRLRFDVLRGGERIGEHEVRFTQSGAMLTVAIQAAMTFKIGPLGIDYAHHASETWRGGEFQTSEATSTINAKPERVTAKRTAAGIEIRTAGGVRTAVAATEPLSHWNAESLSRPLFNPGNGKLLKVAVSRNAPVLPGPTPAPSGARWSLRGQADVDDWYDSDGVWTALRGRLPDRSIVDYRRV